MKRVTSFFLSIALCAVFILCPLLAQETSSSPTFKVLYTFKAEGGTPTGIVEVRPGSFLINSTGNYKYIYGFPPMSSGLAVFGLTPALNGQAYGSASNLGTVPTF